MRADIIPGAKLPDYELPDQDAKKRSLSELQGSDPMIVQLSRGNFCPKEHQHHAELVKLYPKIQVAYTKIVTIVTDTILGVKEFRGAVGAQWTFLADAGRKVPKDLDIEEYTDTHNDPTIPYTFVLEPDLVINKIYNGYWFWGRPSADDLWRDMREVFAKVRPDWDLSTPGLREAWDKGDKRIFYPYEPAR
jgi:peroxiredoxin